METALNYVFENPEVVAATLAYVGSEVIGRNPGLKENTLYQFIVNVFLNLIGKRT